MRDLEIVEGIDVPEEFTQERIDDLIEEFILTDEFDDFIYDDEGVLDYQLHRKVWDTLEENIKESIDYYTHLDGKVYIDDWGEFCERFVTHTKEKLRD